MLAILGCLGTVLTVVGVAGVVVAMMSTSGCADDDGRDGGSTGDVGDGDSEGDIHVDGSDADSDGDIGEVDGDGGDADVDGDGGPDCTAAERNGIEDHYAAIPDPGCHVRDLDIIGNKIYGLCDNSNLIFSCDIGSDHLAPTTCSRVAQMPATTPSLTGGSDFNNTPTQIMDMGSNLLLALYETDGEEDAADYFGYCTSEERTYGCELIVRDGIKIYDTTGAYGSNEFSGISVKTIENPEMGYEVWYTTRQPHSALRMDDTLLMSMGNLNGQYEPGMVNNYSLLSTGEINTDRAVEIPPQFTYGRNPGAMTLLEGNTFVMANRSGAEGSTGLLTGEDAGANIAIVDATEPAGFAVTTVPLGSSVILADLPDLAVGSVGGTKYAIVADNQSPATIYAVDLTSGTHPVRSTVMPAGGLVTSITVSPTTGRLFVTLDTGYIYSADIATMAVSTGIYYCDNPSDSGIHADGNALYVGCTAACGDTGNAQIVAGDPLTL